MARGWESKSVETQQEEAVASRRRGGRAPTPGEVERGARRRTLELARARVAADLGRARSESHRRMLEQALVSLDEQLRGG